jgi:hypothetical protein
MLRNDTPVSVNQQMLRACRRKDIGMLIRLLRGDTPYDINYVGEGGDTPLIVAVLGGWSEGVKILLEYNASVRHIMRFGPKRRRDDPRFDECDHMHDGDTILTLAVKDCLLICSDIDVADVVRMILGAGVCVEDVIDNIETIATYERYLFPGQRPALQRDSEGFLVTDEMLDGRVLRALFENIPREMFHIIEPTCNWRHTAIETHKEFQTLYLKERALTFALSTLPRSVDHGCTSSVLSKEIVHRIIQRIKKLR